MIVVDLRGVPVGGFVDFGVVVSIYVGRFLVVVEPASDADVAGEAVDSFGAVGRGPAFLDAELVTETKKVGEPWWGLFLLAEVVVFPVGWAVKEVAWRHLADCIVDVGGEVCIWVGCESVLVVAVLD